MSLLEPDLEKDFFLHDIQSPFNCQNWQKLAKMPLTSKLQENTLFYQYSVKFGLHFTQEPKNLTQPLVVRLYLIPGLTRTCFVQEGLTVRVPQGGYEDFKFQSLPLSQQNCVY